MEELGREDRQELQRSLVELEEARQTAEALRRQIGLLSDSISEIEMSIQTIQGLTKLNPNTEVLVPIGSDSYVPAELKKTNKVLDDIGGKLVAEREPEEAVKSLDRMKGEIEASRERAQKEMDKVTGRIQELSPKIEKIIAEARKK